MANEATINMSLAYSDGTSSLSLSIVNLLSTVVTKYTTWNRMTVPTSDTAIPLGSVSTLGWMLAVNRDPTNFIEIKTASGGTYFAKLKTGYCMLIPFDPAITAPYAKADTGACIMEYLLLNT